MKSFTLSEVTRAFNDEPTQKLWTAVIPAAGRGSRLGYDKPKILYPIAGRPILDWLIDLLEPNCATLTFVLSPSGMDFVKPILETRLKGRYEIAIQEEPRGMADAIYQAVPQVTTPYTLIIWGDQVAIRSETIRSLMKLQEGNSETVMTLPMVERDAPYVHYVTENGRFTQVFERREDADMPDVGLSDCGVFAFNTNRLQEVFDLELSQGISYSRGTKEWNFLPMLPQFDTGGDSFCSLRLASLEETIGVNDVMDAGRLEKYLKGLE